MKSVNELIVAMDIGTRSVIGVVGVLDGPQLRVIDIERAEHTGRSVIDGQIEDIPKVSKVIRTVADRLEERLGHKITNVCVAAAGRSLITETSTFELSIDSKTPIDRQMVISMEMGAITDAKSRLESSVENASSANYQCVGYSVVRYYLDGYPLNTLIDHRGKIAKVEVIATFLPDEVVVSLYETIKRAGLRVASLTLEPIAAMNLVIPQELRMLNLALVDIGAGTSDIAVSNEGTTSAYAMVTMAGDEITEAIAKAFLTDFPTSELIKFAISESNNPIDYENILGLNYTVTPDEVRRAIVPAAAALGDEICSKILEINGTPPSAIFLVGGGSHTPGLGDYIAEILGIDRKNVAVGGGNYIKRNIQSDLPTSSPDLATPLGIAVTAALGIGNEGFYVFVNDLKTMLFSRELSTVMDALLMSGFKHDHVIGRSGKSLTFTLDGRKTTIRGGLPSLAEVYLNDVSTSVTSLINIGDRILFVPAENGADAQVTVRQIINNAGPAYIIHGREKTPLKQSVKINGKFAPLKTNVSEGDELTLCSKMTLKKLCISLGLDPEAHRFYLNGGERQANTPLKHADEVDFLPIRSDNP